MLSFIPTPIWNKEDITLRALKLLENVSVLFCEDTRTTIKLLRMYEIEWKTKKLYSFTSYTPENKIWEYIELVRDQDCGVVSEAGTPWLSDPGKHLIKLCWDFQLPFEILPWANALIPWVIACPTDTSSFVYKWFLPQKKGRQTVLKEIIQSVYPVFAYESVHRIEKLLKQLDDLWYTGRIYIGREISKMYEQHLVWTTQEMLKYIQDWILQIKWEFVVWFYTDNKKNT